MPYLDTPDTLIAQLTLEGRNLLGRTKTGDIVYIKEGWQLGRGGYSMSNPLKVTEIIDHGTEALGYINIVNNGSSISDWNVGSYVSLNGKQFVFGLPTGTNFTRGATAALTVRGIKNAILDSKDPRHYRLVEPIEDGDRLMIRSLITGDIGNSYPISVYNVGQLPTDPNRNLGFTPLSGGTSAFLEDPSWPVPSPTPLIPSLAPFSGVEGLVELPDTSALSFMTRVGEGAGLGAYGEIGIWVKVLKSNFPSEIGRHVLFAIAHFPIQPKNDRAVITFRVIVAF